ncbi:hypothetical protein GNZ12_25895 [Paraburkholderia sp. 1N]|uniref:MFS transporter n=1 Tax=Paraburkholderia solitsugae TaxID=2675748 RepID=A0ABX2BX66_9BURK|nr:hypothetical protein [Paraburkholderia solitsugae]
MRQPGRSGSIRRCDVRFVTLSSARFVLTAVSAPFAFGAPCFAVTPILVISLAMPVIMAETTGNVLAIGTIIGRPSSQTTLGNAFRADGLSTMLGGVFNSFPCNAFKQNTAQFPGSRVPSPAQSSTDRPPTRSGHAPVRTPGQHAATQR